VGTETGKIVAETIHFLDSTENFAKTNFINPFGDGQAARRIVDSIQTHMETTA
jgi:UDP-N-acetylglucosamine 2-epimerase